MATGTLLRLLGFSGVLLFLFPATASAALDGAADSSTFASQFDGNQIFDGTSLINDWVQNGGHTPAAFSLSGGTLVVTPDANNGWVEHDNDFTPWELSAGSWTLEVEVKLNDTDPGVNDGLVLWGERDGNRGVLWIQAGSITDLSGTVLADGLDNTDGFHTIRVAYDSNEALHHVWRDGALLSGAGVDINLAGGNLSRLIIGDCCTGIGNPVDQFELGYVRYQADQALAVIPEPTTAILIGLGCLGLMSGRRCYCRG